MTTPFDQIIHRRGTDSLKWHFYEPDVLPMWVADMDFAAPPAVIAALHERVEHGVFGYGKDPVALRQVLVERMARLYNWTIKAEDLVFIPGVVAGFNLVFQGLGQPGEGVLMQTPVYPPMLTGPRNAGMERHEMELTCLPDGSYTIDWDAFEAAIHPNTRIFILCNPHNPVGRVFRRDELERMAEICLRHNLLLCSDEIHCDLLFSGQQHIPLASLSAEIADRTITLMAPSKTFNIPGLECSFAIIPNPELRKKFVAAQRDLMHGCNVLGITAAEAAYRAGQPWLDETLAYLEGNRDALYEFVRSELAGVRMAKPEGTYLAWLDCRDLGLPGHPADFFIEKAKVGLNPGHWFGKGGTGFVRLNFACPRSLLDEALAKMAGALRDR